MIVKYRVIHSTFSVTRRCANFVARLKPLDKDKGFGVAISSHWITPSLQSRVGLQPVTLYNGCKQSSAGVVRPEENGEGSVLAELLRIEELSCNS